VDAAIRAQFGSAYVHLDTACYGLLPAPAADAAHLLLRELGAHRVMGAGPFEDIDACRRSFARISGVPTGRVALGSAVSVSVGLVASALPAGAEVLCAEGEFISLTNPFAVRPDLKVRTVPLADLAASVRPGTDLVAVSSVQSGTGRLADLAAVRAAARSHGARTLVDTTQECGWRPVRAAGFDVTVCSAHKWLLCPRGVSFLTVSEEAQEWILPRHACWMAGADPLGPPADAVQLARDARRYDQSVPALPYAAGRHSLELIAELGVERVGRHNIALADRFRAGAVRLGLEPAPAPGSAIVLVPGAAHAVGHLHRAGITATDRSGLRCSFHLYNTEEHVDRALNVLEESLSARAT
jgi:selenocysteine lyase/cysteine desulfurase